MSKGETMETEKRKYQDKTTSELLDFIAKDFDYNQSDKKAIQQDYQDELDHRIPFSHIRNKIDHQSREIKELKEKVNLLMKHKHLDGEVVIKIAERV